MAGDHLRLTGSPVFTRHLLLHTAGTTPEPLADLAKVIELMLPSFPEHESRRVLIMHYRGELSVHLSCGLRASCVRFTEFVPCGICLGIPNRFSVSPPFHHRSFPLSAQHSVPNYWLDIIEAGITAH